MRFSLVRPVMIAALTAALLLGDASAAGQPTPEELAEIARLNDAKAKWEKAGRPGPENEISEALIDAAVSTDRPDVVENIVARGKLKTLRIPVSRGGKAVTLREVRRFPEIETTLADELLHGDWVARRITRDRLEVWTATHGWLLDGAGRLVAEAHVFRQGGTGREWHGAFLPDGQWITTQVSENDSTLSFFTAKGGLSRVLKCSDLAARTPEDEGVDLIGWARSDKDGRGWDYSVGSVDEDDDRRDGDHTFQRSLSIVPNGEYVFGFWPGGARMFAGSTRYLDDTSKSVASRKYAYSLETTETGTRWNRGNAIEDKTWFYNADGQCTGWIAGRRIGDATDGKSMLFRLTADSRVAVLKPDLTVGSTRRLRWKDGTTADALALWDDLRCGLFVRDRKLVLAAW